MKNVLKMAAVAGLMSASVVANAGVIDLFSTHQYYNDPINGPSTYSDGVVLNSGANDSRGTYSAVNTPDPLHGDLIGGQRELFIMTTHSNDLGGSYSLGHRWTTSRARIGVLPTTEGSADGKLSFSVDNGAQGMGVVQWDGEDAVAPSQVFNTATWPSLNVTGLGGIDLTNGGTLDAFALDILSSDLGFNFVIELYTDANTWTKASLLASSVLSPVTHYIEFADFLACGATGPQILSITCGTNGAVDVTNLGAIQLILSGGSGTVDLGLDNIRTVPEPSALALMGAGLLGAGLMSRRRKAKQA